MVCAAGQRLILVRAIVGFSAGLFVGLAASLFLHEGVWGFTAVWAVAVSGLVTAVVRSSWVDLPPFVTDWLDVGVFVVGVLFVVATTGLTSGLAYFVLRWTRVVALLGAAGMLGIAVAGLAYTHRRLEHEVRVTSERLALAQRRALESRLTALSAQINPHFLFNTLNTLAEVVHEDEDRAEDLITDLASMMRYVLDSSAKRVTLEEELNVVRRLLHIESARLGDRLAFDVQIDTNAGSTRIPGLLVQPLVENAVRHGVASRQEGGTVTVSARRDGPRVCVVVEDDGPGVPEAIRDALQTVLHDDEHPGGLRNVYERLRLGWPEGQAGLTISSNPTRLVLTIPAEGP